MPLRGEGGLVRLNPFKGGKTDYIMKRVLSLVLVLLLAASAFAYSVTVTGPEEILVEDEHRDSEFTQTFELTGAETGYRYGRLHVEKEWNEDDVAIAFDREVRFDLRRLPEGMHMFFYSRSKGCDGLKFSIEMYYPKTDMIGRTSTIYLPSHSLPRHADCEVYDKIQLIASSTEDGQICIDYDYDDLKVKDGDTLMFHGLDLYVNSRKVEGELDDSTEYWAGRGIKCPTWTGEVTIPEVVEDEPPAAEPVVDAGEPAVDTVEPPAQESAPATVEPEAPPAKKTSGNEYQVPTEGLLGAFARFLDWFFDYADWLGGWLG